MKSILFLIACSFCAACGVFATEPVEATIVTEESLACQNCRRPACPGCEIACSGCQSILLACKDGKKPGCTCPKEVSEDTLACKCRGKGKHIIACKDGKKPGCTCPKEVSEDTLACKCRGKGKHSLA